MGQAQLHGRSDPLCIKRLWHDTYVPTVPRFPKSDNLPQKVKVDHPENQVGVEGSASLCQSGTLLHPQCCEWCENTAMSVVCGTTMLGSMPPSVKILPTLAGALNPAQKIQTVLHENRIEHIIFFKHKSSNPPYHRIPTLLGHVVCFDTIFQVGKLSSIKEQCDSRLSFANEHPGSKTKLRN
eukprot:5178261-Amphidinium_carterae.1